LLYKDYNISTFFDEKAVGLYHVNAKITHVLDLGHDGMVKVIVKISVNIIFLGFVWI